MADALIVDLHDVVEEPEEKEQPGFKVSEERLARRKLIDRENMQAVYDAKSSLFKLAKRAGDIALSGAALIALSPIMLGAAIAIVIEDGRPIIYAAPREGKNGKPFKMYKFRSMYRDAESKLQELLSQNEQTGPAFKIKNDPRITKVGDFIRKTSIDELPQLVNILKGEMSIVGPRAIQKTQEYTPYEAQRLVVQPGLSCYWQISGRANVSWEDWVELDLDYIQDMSLWTDIKIIAKTFGVVFKGTGSY